MNIEIFRMLIEEASSDKKFLKKYQKYFDMFSNESSQDLANILKIGDYIG